MILKSLLIQEYIKKKRSVKDIADSLGCSQTKVTYWLKKHSIAKRSISDALYQKNNPKGDPFKACALDSNEKWFLYGLGLGLYWGEGNKANTQAVRLGNTDPDLILIFIKFLKETYKIDESKLRFGLQIFNDMKPDEVVNFWVRYLKVNKKQFHKPVVTKSVRSGTYKKKSKYGVLTIYFSNTKLRDIIMAAINDLRTAS